MQDDQIPQCPMRRGFLKTGGAAVAAGVACAAAPLAARAATASEGTHAAAGAASDVEPFYGTHQGGIATPQQSHAYMAAFDLTTTKRADVIALLKAWTSAAERMSRGLPAVALESGAENKPPVDSGDVLELSPSNLTITFGFGPGLFSKDGKDRYGLASKRPAALVDLPRFNGDQMIPEKCGGDLFIQACANDTQVAFHAVRQLARIGQDSTAMRWGQAGFLSGKTGETPRNLMGFKDGTMNPGPKDMDSFVWAGNEGPHWMSGGSYAVMRRIRITIEHWDNTELDFQEQVFGRQKRSGAPLGGKTEFEALDLDKTDKDGNPVIPENAHARLSSPATNNGAQILRRSYSYNDGTNFYIERWPPWRQQMEYDAGLMFVAFQSDPRKGFIPINEKLSKFDILNQFTTHIGSAIFACPPGAQPGSYVGAPLFEA